MNNLYCPQCGEKLKSSDQKFCDHCGADLRISMKTSDSDVTTIKESKRCFILGLSSFIIAIIFIIIGLALILILRNSVQSTYYIFYESYYFDEELKLVTEVFGLVAILSSIAGCSLGIISRMIRQKLRANESKNLFIDMGGVFAILGIVLNIIAIVIAIILIYLPFFKGLFISLRRKYRGIY